jgi:hypothetical protein
VKLRAALLALAASALSGSLARAAGDPLIAEVERLKAGSCPDCKRSGEFLFGQTEKTDWMVDLTPGNCYWIIGAADGDVRAIAFYIWDPGNRRVLVNKEEHPHNITGYCPEQPGKFHLQAKAGGHGQFRVALFSKPGTKMPEPPPPAPEVVAPSHLAPGIDCNDSSRAGNNSTLVVSCDCNFAMSVDGQPGPQGANSSARVEGLGGGCHTVTLDVWSGLFKHAVWYSGKITLAPNAETRYQLRKGGVDFVGKTALAPRPSADGVAALDEALDYLRDARDANEDADGRCHDRVADKLQSIGDLISDARRSPSGETVGRALRKAKDTAGYVDDECGDRAARQIQRKLRRLIDRLESARAGIP